LPDGFGSLAGVFAFRFHPRAMTPSSISSLMPAVAHAAMRRTEVDTHDHVDLELTMGRGAGVRRSCAGHRCTKVKKGLYLRGPFGMRHRNSL